MDKLKYQYDSDSDDADDADDSIPIKELLKRKQEAAKQAEQSNEKSNTDKRRLDTLSSEEILVQSVSKKKKTQEHKMSSERKSSINKRKLSMEEETSENPKDSDDNIFRKLPELIAKQITTSPTEETYYISRNIFVLEEQIKSTKDDTSNNGGKEVINKVNKLHF